MANLWFHTLCYGSLGQRQTRGEKGICVQEATPTARWPIRDLLPMPMPFMSFLDISLLLVWAPTFCFPSILWPFVTLWLSDTQHLCKPVSFSFSRSFLPETSFPAVASGEQLWLVDGVWEIALPSECSALGQLVSSEASSGSVVFTDSLVLGDWSVPAFKHDFDPAAALLPGLVDLDRALLTLLLLNITWEIKRPPTSAYFWLYLLPNKNLKALIRYRKERFWL